MPTAHDTHDPRPHKDRCGTLFDIIVPDHPDRTTPATAEDVRRYEQLRGAVAEILFFLVDEVRRNYSQRRGTSFDNRTIRQFMIRCAALSRDFFDGTPTPRQIGKALDRTAKRFGLIVHSTEPGQRRGWPRHGRPTFTRADAAAVVDDAFHGRWPRTPGGQP